MAFEILSEKGEPTHVNKISEGIKKKFNKRLRPAYLAAILYRSMKKGKLFYKAEGRPNTFGLLEWQVKRSPVPPSQVGHQVQ